MNIFLQAAPYVLATDRRYARPTESSISLGLFDYLGWAAIILFVAWFLSLLIRPKVAMKSWHHHFAGLSLSANELNAKIINEIQSRKTPDVKFSHAKFFEAGIFSARRGCLCIDFKKFTIDVSCIQFGTGFYVSWWLIREDPGVLSRIPILRDLFGINPEHQSYYQLDTATLFQSAVHDSILAVMDKESNAHGIRPLTEFERQPMAGKYAAHMLS